MSIETKIFATIRMYLQAYEKRFTDPDLLQKWAKRVILKVKSRHRTNQCPCVRMSRTIENILAVSALYNHTGVHNGNLLRNICYNTKLMCSDDD